ncbi:MAG: aromatic amino acid lyase, partial [Acidobacteriia bacterium]|nr:aromatic amino acid lyase [Terriglobia bacterium]
GNKEDFVSMGQTAALKLQQVVKNTRAVLAIEALTAARALDLLAPLKSGIAVEQARASLRIACPAWEGDQTLSDRILAVDEWIRSGALDGV